MLWNLLVLFLSECCQFRRQLGVQAGHAAPLDESLLNLKLASGLLAVEVVEGDCLAQEAPPFACVCCFRELRGGRFDPHLDYGPQEA